MKYIVTILINIVIVYSIAHRNAQIPEQDQENLEITKEAIKLVNKIEHQILVSNAQFDKKHKIPEATKTYNITSTTGISDVKKNTKAIEDSRMFEGDIILTLNQAENIVKDTISQAEKKGVDISSIVSSTNIRKKRKIDGDIKYNWTFPIMYYVDDKVNASLVSKALNLLEEETCIRFNKTNTILKNTQGLRYYFGPGCFSYVGKMYNNSMQDVSLGENCDTIGTIQHETLHALGFDHEQCRADRDNHLNIFLENVQSNGENNFVKLSENKAITFGIPYDYGSVMQYTSTAFSKNNTYTMLPKKSLYNETLGLDEKASFLDIKLLNHYYCNDKCSKKLNCENGGYTDPNNCTICKCIEGFTGELCDELPPTTKKCNESLRFVYPTEESMSILGVNDCIYHFLAKDNEEIELTIEAARFFPAFFPVCYLENSLEVKYLADKSLTGAILCGGKKELVIKPENHHLMLHYRSSQADNGVMFYYRSLKRK